MIILTNQILKSQNISFLLSWEKRMNLNAKKELLVKLPFLNFKLFHFTD